MDDRDDGTDDDRSTDVRTGPTTSSGVTGGGAPDLDEFLQLLSNRRRRYALYCLRERDLRDRHVLARHVAAELIGTTPEDVADVQVEEVETMLVHVDVPMLEDAGVVSADHRTGTLCLDRPSAEIEALLDACAALDGLDSSAGVGSDTGSSDDVAEK